MIGLMQTNNANLGFGAKNITLTSKAGKPVNFFLNTYQSGKNKILSITNSNHESVIDYRVNVFGEIKEASIKNGNRGRSNPAAVQAVNQIKGFAGQLLKALTGKGRRLVVKPEYLN